MISICDEYVMKAETETRDVEGRSNRNTLRQNLMPNNTNNVCVNVPNVQNVPVVPSFTM
jgi:hypothetical protein